MQELVVTAEDEELEVQLETASSPSQELGEPAGAKDEAGLKIATYRHSQICPLELLCISCTSFISLIFL